MKTFKVGILVSPWQSSRFPRCLRRFADLAALAGLPDRRHAVLGHVRIGLCGAVFAG